MIAELAQARTKWVVKFALEAIADLVELRIVSGDRRIQPRISSRDSALVYWAIVPFSAIDASGGAAAPKINVEVKTEDDMISIVPVKLISWRKNKSRPNRR